MARWEDAQYSFNFFRSSYQPNFGMVVFSKRLDALARLAVVEAIRRDEQEAPQREVDRQKKEAQETHATEEKARLANKATFTQRFAPSGVNAGCPRRPATSGLRDALTTLKEEFMSQRNGDKARFDRERKKKSLHRQRIRELRKVLALQNKTTPAP